MHWFQCKDSLCWHGTQSLEMEPHMWTPGCLRAWDMGALLIEKGHREPRSMNPKRKRLL